jgi:hypothetical protein
MDIKKKQQFMTAVRKVPAHRVAKALGYLTPGVNWYGCSKGLMAERYADDRRSVVHRALRAPDLLQKLHAEIDRLQTQD